MNSENLPLDVGFYSKGIQNVLSKTTKLITLNNLILDQFQFTKILESAHQAESLSIINSVIENDFVLEIDNSLMFRIAQLSFAGSGAKEK